MSRQPYAKSDHRTRAAKAQGFPARSVFKLEDIDKRFKLLRAGQRVIDLGAAPGSWSLYAAERIGAGGRLLSIDLQPIEQSFPAQVTVLQADALALGSDALKSAGPYDLVLSDMAPKTGSDKSQNAARSQQLFLSALAVAETHGAVGCHFVGKLFMGGDFGEAKAAIGRLFERHSVVRPKSVRKNSVEVFLVGLCKRAAPSG